MNKYLFVKDGFISKYIVKLFAIIIFFISNNVRPAKIDKTSRIKLAGQITFNAIPANPDSTINWAVDLILIDEQNKIADTTKSIESAQGNSAKFLLIKYSGKFTFYNIIADDGISKDTFNVQVFNSGSPQKYLFTNPDYPAKPVIVYLIIPSSFSENSKFIMVMHGTNRNADDYISVWRSFANEHDFICAAPEFNSTDWPHARSYNLGNMFTGNNGTGNLNPQKKWSFCVVKKIHDELNKNLGLKDSTYNIWGHSAGAQFVHRMLFFCPDYKIKYAIAANAGWYTAPDFTIPFPWGYSNQFLNYDEDNLDDYLNRNLIIMRGTADTLRDHNLNTSQLSDAQGLNRFERALYFYNKGLSINSHTRWQLIDVPDVGHDFTNMAPAAQSFLIDNIDGMETAKNNLTKHFKLYQNYPNPFNPSTKIKFELPEISNIELSIFNILGQKIATLFKGIKNAGYYEYSFDAGNLPSGVYFYQIITKKYSLAKKMILLR